MGNRGTVRISIGAFLIVLQLLSLAGNAKAGVDISISFDSISALLYDLIFLLSYCAMGIIGVVFLVSGVKARAGRSSRKTPECGKQYFRFRVPPKCLLATGQCLLVLALVAVIIFQYAQYKADIAALTEKVENLDMQCLRKESEIKELQYDIHYAETRLEFYNKYVVFVPADGDKYHKLGCRYFNPFWVAFDSSSQFYALDDDMAEYLGYTPCSQCCD